MRNVVKKQTSSVITSHDESQIAVFSESKSLLYRSISTGWKYCFMTMCVHVFSLCYNYFNDRLRFTHTSLCKKYNKIF